MKIDLTHLSKSQLNKLQRIVFAITEKIDTVYLVCTELRKEHCLYRNCLHKDETVCTCHIELLLLCQDAVCPNLDETQALAKKLSTDQFSCVITCYTLSHARQLLQDGDRYLDTAMRSGAVLHQHNMMLPTKKGYSSSQELLENIRTYWSRCFGNACKFLDCALFCIAEGHYDMAAFMAHQTVEHTCKAMLHSFSQSCPQTHNINYLLKRCAYLHPDILKLFPKECPKDTQLIKQMKQSYIEARYTPNFTVREEAIWEMVDRAGQLQRIAGELCNERIMLLQANAIIC